MNKENDTSLSRQPSTHTHVSDEPAPAGGKAPFVEPEISVPVDVLEATTFFQGLTSGATLP